MACYSSKGWISQAIGTQRWWHLEAQGVQKYWWVEWAKAGAESAAVGHTIFFLPFPGQICQYEATQTCTSNLAGEILYE